MFSIFFSEILLKYLNLSWSFLRRSLTFGSVYHLLIFKPKSVVYYLFNKFKKTKQKNLQRNNFPKPCGNRKFIWPNQKRTHWKSIYHYTQQKFDKLFNQFPDKSVRGRIFFMKHKSCSIISTHCMKKIKMISQTIGEKIQVL